MLSLMFGIYTLRLKRSAENWAFFATAVALSIWSLGLGFALSSPSEDVSILWRRVAAVGWGTFFSHLLYFILAMTGKSKWLKKPWTYIVIYLPALVNLLAFAIPAGLNPQPYTMINTDAGWINVSENTGWDYYYIICYISLVVAILAAVWHWGSKSGDRNVKRQSRAILITFAIALALSTLTDVVANAVFAVKIPQVAPLIIMIPFIVFYLIVHRYGLLHHTPFKKSEEILTPSARQRIYKYLSIVLITGGLVNFILQYVLVAVNLVPTLVLSAVFILDGVIIHFVNRLNISNRTKDVISILSVSITIPIFILNNIQYASVTVWAYPFILVIAALVFNKGVVLGAVSVVTLMTQVTIWIVSPGGSVTIDPNDYTGRIVIFVVGIALAFYVNRVYVARLKQNTDQIALQTLISEISTDFVTATQHNIGEKIDCLLAKAGAFFEADRAFAYFFDGKSQLLCCENAWYADEGGRIAVVDRQALTFAVGDHPWWVKQILEREVVHFSDLQKQPEYVVQGKCFLDEECRSMLCIPITGRESVQGFLAFVATRSTRPWRDEHIGLLKMIANTLADAKLKAEAEKEISHMAYYDHLTGLPNRQLFRDRLTQAVLTAGRTGRRLGVIFLDLDSFKAVNDTLGHERGDELLRVIAGRLKKCVRQSDTVARFGGDEFLLLISNLVRENDIVKVAEKIMKLFRKPFVLKGQEFYVTASAGIAMYPADGTDTDELIKNADIAMYSAKEAGKNQYTMCSHEMKATVSSSVSLTTSLYRALDREELLIYYQPQMCLQTQRIIGLEALLRWNSPEHGMVSPGRFIPLAEQTGLINPIGEWVLQQACRQNKQWQEMGLPPVRMAVNLSVVQLRNPRLRDIVRETLEVTGLKSAYLELEITESVATKEADYIVELLGRLKSLGVTLSIDDFGTEYSSLSRLKMLPVDRIKMDMQFVHGIEESDKDKAITKLIIGLAKNLGLKVIAEGVETEKQLNFLHQKMCDEVQGFYYFRPMPPEQVELVLRNQYTVPEYISEAPKCLTLHP
jgi:diguanylate cyclase (GGDEF)-like protein